MSVCLYDFFSQMGGISWMLNIISGDQEVNCVTKSSWEWVNQPVNMDVCFYHQLGMESNFNWKTYLDTEPQCAMMWTVMICWIKVAPEIKFKITLCYTAKVAGFIGVTFICSSQV